MKPTFYVVARVERAKPWQVVAKTHDRDFAEATAQQFRDAKVPVRVDVVDKAGKLVSA